MSAAAPASLFDDPRAAHVRVRAANSAPIRPERAYILYWMTAARRTHHNVALDRALALAHTLDRPLVVLEALRVGYRWASARHHRFVLDGMADNRARFAAAGIAYHAYVEPVDGAGRGLVDALAASACVVVADDWPAFFLGRMLSAAAARADVRVEAVDGNGLFPMRAATKEHQRAVDFRRMLQRTLPDYLSDVPRADPLEAHGTRAGEIPENVLRQWPAASATLLGGDAESLAAIPVDASVAPGPVRGGAVAAEARLAAWLDTGLDAYAEARSDPDADAASRLSPWLHFGHIGTHGVFAALTRREGWTAARLGAERRGAKDGFWGVSPSGDAFLDELVTWRELAMHTAVHRPGFEAYDSLPDWARRVLAERADDPRPTRYDLDALDAARTHDRVWNAAQRQLVREGRMPNYLRMLWGKKVLEWSARPEIAFETLVHLNNRYAVDGRDPSSYAGIAWIFGRYDRPWAPKRPIFGSIRYMSSDSTVKKLHLKRWLTAWG